MKKIWKVLLASTMALGLSIGLIACNAGGMGGGQLGGQNGHGTVSGATDAVQSRYAFSAATAGSILSAMQGGSAQQLAVAKGLSLGRSAVTDEATIATLNDYMFLVEGLLGDGSFGMTTENSDRAEYAVKATVSYSDIEGNTLSYLLYYNETERTVGRDRDDWDDRFEDERVYDIDGIMVVDHEEYPIYGRTEAESDWGESESETQFVVQMSQTRSMYVTQESENEGNESEEEYAYTIRENSRTVERSVFSYEQEGSQTEIEFSLTKDGQTQVFYFEQDGRHGIRIYVGDRYTGTAYRVHVETDANGNSYYVYEAGGGNYRMERPDFD